MKRLTFLGVAALLAAACTSDRVAGPTEAGLLSSEATLAAAATATGSYALPAPQAHGLRVQTYNLYLGTNLWPIMAATTPEEALAGAAMAYAELQQTDFRARAGAIAAQIAKVRPDVIGLQEAVEWSLSAPYVPGGPPTAPFVVQYDFVQLVLDSLGARGLQYANASSEWTTDVAAPVPTAFTDGYPTAFALVRFHDRDAILVRAGVQYADPQSGVYTAYVPLPQLGAGVGLYRGWCSVRVTRDSRTFRFVNTHPEAESAEIDYLQIQELAGLLASETDPVVWVGDFNADAVTQVPAYQLAIAAGFTDLWSAAHPRDPGLSNGPNDGVGALDANGVLVPYSSIQVDKRIDLILVRNPLGQPAAVHAAMFGNQLSDRTPGGLWPSDHFTVAAVFEMPDR